MEFTIQSIYTSVDNYAGSGPREWLFIYDETYSGATMNPADTVSSLSNPMTIMYFATWTRRSNVAWKNIDRLVLTPNRINTIATTFTYTVPKAIPRFGC